MSYDPKNSKVGHLNRRELLKLSPLLAMGAFAIPKLRTPLLKSGIAFTDWAASQWFRPGHLAPTFADSEVTPFEKFSVNTYDVDDPGVNLDKWKLKVSGAVEHSGEYTLSEIRALPKLKHNTRHICVEGWDAIVAFAGVRISDFLDHVGADRSAKFLYFECADDYYESIDMDTARHPQSLLAYEMYGRSLSREHGAPLRLRLPTKIGYKSAKYLTSLQVTDVIPKAGYWEDQGYPGYYGL